MNSAFGNIFLISACIFSFIQSAFTLWGYRKNNIYFLALARPAAWAQLIFLGLAYLILMTAFVTNDFSLSYVAANSHPTLPLLYRLTAAWGGHEGSLLLWTVVLAIWTVVYAECYKNTPLSQLVIAILGIISFCFLNFLILTSNPFSALAQSGQAHDLNPLLQDPGFIIHPPMLYTGYVGFAAAFAITLASLIRKNLDTAWARTTRYFATAAWCFLTLGIALGSWWAYRVLGWGGFWFWDPVENASLLPWLTGIALIHLLVLAEKREQAQSWAAFMALMCFCLSLLGTFLVRSGILISVHSFASDPARGIFLLLLFGSMMTVSLYIYVKRLAHFTPSSSAVHAWLSREMMLTIQSVLLFISMLTILLGTLYPLILDALGFPAISVGAPYFNLSMGMLGLITMFFMGLGPLCRWQKQANTHLFFISLKKIMISFSAAILLLWLFAQTLSINVIVGLFLSFWVIQGVIDSRRLLPAMTLAHIGFAVFIIGIIISSSFSQERLLKMAEGSHANIGPYQFYFMKTTGIAGSNYRGIRGHFHVTKGEHHITDLYPEKRIYPVRNDVMSKVDIHPSVFRDLYIALGEPLTQTAWTVRLYYKPFIRWIWGGALLMILGGLVSLFQRNHIRVSHEIN